jgi:hypothetical protein
MSLLASHEVDLAPLQVYRTKAKFDDVNVAHIQ